MRTSTGDENVILYSLAFRYYKKHKEEMIALVGITNVCKTQSTVRQIKQDPIYHGFSDDPTRKSSDLALVKVHRK